MGQVKNSDNNKLEYLYSLEKYIEDMGECSQEAEKKIKLINTVEEYFKRGVKLISENIFAEEEEVYFQNIKTALKYLEKRDAKNAMRVINSLTEKKEKVILPFRYHVQDIIAKNNLYTHKFSICMIVKNEENNIERCLKSLKPLVEKGFAELVIVDTGSTDKTIEIAKKYSENIYFHPWRDSFSEARNWSISLGTGEYIFIVDGDDEIKESEIEKIISEFSKEEHKMYNTFSMKVKSYLDLKFETSTIITQNHIFKNDGSLYYSGSIHNQPYSALPLKDLDITITHYGYIMTPELSEKKFNRTVPLLLKELKECIDVQREMYYRYQLSVSYGMHGDLDKALEETNFLVNKIKNLEFDTTYLIYLSNAALIYKGVEYYDEVLEICDLGLDNQSDFIDLLYLKAEAFFCIKQYEKAIEWLKKYIELSESFSNHEIYNDTRFSFYYLEAQEAAIKMLLLSYIKTGKDIEVLTNFNSADEYFNFAEECVNVNAYTQAIYFYKCGLKLEDTNYNGYNNLAYLLNVIGNNDKANFYYKEALKYCDNEDKVQIYSNYLLSLNYNRAYSNEEIFLEHKKYNDILKHDSSKVIRYRDTFNMNRKIRLGYMSSDFKQHPVMYFAAGPIVGHNERDFEVYCYSNVLKTDGITDGLRNYIKNWRDISQMNNEEVNKLIVEDEIDILIDLGGHTGKNRLAIFSEKPAPVQVTWIGYPNTTGLNTIDYRITDNYADPLQNGHMYHTEKLIRMPKSFLCYSAGEFPEVKDVIPYKRNNKITFASFNNFTKVTEDAIRVWSDILKKVERSTLILKSEIFEDKIIEQDTLKRFEEYGVDNEQIKLLTSDKKFKDHLNRYNDVDIALDTFPYNGTTTTCEAMYMGVPVITLAGDRHVARVGVSLLSNVGLTELIAYSEAEYIEKAVNLAKDIEGLEKIKLSLRKKTIDSPIMKVDAFVLDLEEIYKTMWKNYCNENLQNQIKREIEKEINNGNLDAANALIGEYEEVVKNDLEICSMKAIIEIMKNNLKVAEEILTEGLKIDSENYDLLMNMSYLQEVSGDLQSAAYFKDRAAKKIG